MQKGRFLGFSLDSGDDFTFIIATEPDLADSPRRIYTRSVIRPRYVREDPPVVRKRPHKFEIYRRESTELIAIDEDNEIPTPLVDQPRAPLQAIDEEPPIIDDVAQFEAGLAEVFGPPPAERLRIDETSPEIP